MFDFKFKFWSKSLLICGVLLTVVSAIITNSLLEKNSSDIFSLNKDSLRIENRIDDHWKSLRDAESKLDLVMNVLLSFEPGNPKIKVANKYFYDWFVRVDIAANNIDKNSTIGDYVELVKSFRDESINKINNLYLQKIHLEDEKNEILERSMFLRNLALLFQILGLILVLSSGGKARIS
jgi:hypothetical protein